MEEGFIPNATRGQLFWFAGEPAKTYRESFMFGRRRAAITTNRCTSCGYLESYAKE
jgi:hypothetical protein